MVMIFLVAKYHTMAFLKMECAKNITKFFGRQWGVSISVMWVYILPEYTC
jgi:hypothetical protein